MSALTPLPTHDLAPPADLSPLPGRWQQLAAGLRTARVSNPALEFWLDSHPAQGDPGRLDPTVVARTIVRGGEPDADDVAAQITGVTTNPNLIAEYDAVRFTGGRSAHSRDSRYASHIAEAATVLRTHHETSEGRYGWVSAQVSPEHTFDAHAIVEEGLRLAALGPNVMVKVPGSAQGYRAIRTLVGNGVSVNGTLSYSLAQFRAFGEAVAQARATLDTATNTRLRTVVTHMAGRVGDALVSAGLGTSPGELRRTARLAECALARRGSALLAEVEPRSTLLLSSIRVDRDVPRACTHLTSVLDRPVALTMKPSVLGDLADAGPDAFVPDPDLGAEVDAWEPQGPVADLVRPLFDTGLPAEKFWTLPPFLHTLAEASTSHVRMIGGRHAA